MFNNDPNQPQTQNNSAQPAQVDQSTEQNSYVDSYTPPTGVQAPAQTQQPATPPTQPQTKPPAEPQPPVQSLSSNLGNNPVNPLQQQKQDLDQGIANQQQDQAGFKNQTTTAQKLLVDQTQLELETPQDQPQQAFKTVQPEEQPPQTPKETTQEKIEKKKPANDKEEALISQNIFDLLGVTDGTEAQRNEFLDELQQAIWEDFLENDLELLVTDNEREQVKKILDDAKLQEIEKQEKILEYLDKLIPDLEQILLEKAVQLKQELLQERMAGMREYYAQDQKALAEIDRAASLIIQGKWKTGSEVLNQIGQ